MPDTEVDGVTHLSRPILARLPCQGSEGPRNLSPTSDLHAHRTSLRKERAFWPTSLITQLNLEELHTMQQTVHRPRDRPPHVARRAQRHPAIVHHAFHLKFYISNDFANHGVSGEWLLRPRKEFL